MNEAFSVESLLFKDSFHETIKPVSSVESITTKDDIIKSRIQAVEDLKFFDTYNMLNEYNTNQKVRMLKRLNNITNNIRNKNITNSCESYIKSELYSCEMSLRDTYFTISNLKEFTNHKRYKIIKTDIDNWMKKKEYTSPTKDEAIKYVKKTYPISSKFFNIEIIDGIVYMLSPTSDFTLIHDIKNIIKKQRALYAFALGKDKNGKIHYKKPAVCRIRKDKDEFKQGAKDIKNSGK